MDQERMNHHRQKNFRENARFVNTNIPSDSKPTYNNKKSSGKKIIRCKYCYRTDTLIPIVQTNKENDHLQCLNGYPKLRACHARRKDT